MVESLIEMVKTIACLVAISLFEIILFFLMVFIATKESILSLSKSFFKTSLEALLFVIVIFLLLLFFIQKNEFKDITSVYIFFEQMYGFILFLALLFMSSMHYPAFAKEKYRYAFFGLSALFVFLLWGMSVIHYVL